MDGDDDYLIKPIGDRFTLIPIDVGPRVRVWVELPKHVSADTI